MKHLESGAKLNHKRARLLCSLRSPSREKHIICKENKNKSEIVRKEFQWCSQ